MPRLALAAIRQKAQANRCRCRQSVRQGAHSRPAALPLSPRYARRGAGPQSATDLAKWDRCVRPTHRAMQIRPAAFPSQPLQPLPLGGQNGSRRQAAVSPVVEGNPVRARRKSSKTPEHAQEPQGFAPQAPYRRSRFASAQNHRQGLRVPPAPESTPTAGRHREMRHRQRRHCCPMRAVRTSAPRRVPPALATGPAGSPAAWAQALPVPVRPTHQTPACNVRSAPIHRRFAIGLQPP